MKRAALRYALRLATLLGVAYLGIVALMAFRETRLVYVGAFMESNVGREVPSVAGFAWDTVRVTASDGVPTLVLVAERDSMPGPWAIFFHGNGGVLGRAGSVLRYRILQEAGFHVAAVEYRGYGASAHLGPPSERGLYADAMAGWDYVTDSLGVAPQRVVPYGWSLGSGLATYVATQAEPGAVVTEGGFTSLPDAGADVYPWLPVRMIARNRFDNLARATGLDLPWLVLHGRSDADVDFAHGEALAAAARGARLVPLDAGHDDGVTADRQVAVEALRALARSVAGG